MKANLLPEDEAVGKEAARYIRFASAAYGMLMLKVLRCVAYLLYVRLPVQYDTVVHY